MAGAHDRDIELSPWHVGGVVFDGQQPVVFGIVNTTPDSFSDGGVAHEPGNPDVAVQRGLALVADGADVIDVGGESTRPGALSVSLDEELQRTIPVVRGLAAAGVIVSIDTTKAAVASAALAAGAQIVNDVSAGRVDDRMVDVIADADAACVLMHMRGSPRTMQIAPVYDDVVADVQAFLAERMQALVDRGLAAQRIAVDPGIGFGKTLEHNLTLLGHTESFCALGPVLIGASRKSFIGQLSGIEEPAARDPASIAVAADAVLHGATAVRVHDVAGTRQAVDVAAALRSHRG